MLEWNYRWKLCFLWENRKEYLSCATANAVKIVSTVTNFEFSSFSAKRKISTDDAKSSPNSANANSSTDSSTNFRSNVSTALFQTASLIAEGTKCGKQRVKNSFDFHWN